MDPVAATPPVAAAAPPAPPRVAATVRFEPDVDTSKAALLAAIARDGATSLKVILWRCNAAVDDDVVSAVAEHCPGLTELNVRRCTAITDVGLGAIKQRFPGLVVLQ
jgi:hypothetical protein